MGRCSRSGSPWGDRAGPAVTVDVLAASTGRSDATALVSPDRAWSYDQLSVSVDERAEALRAEGVTADEPLVLVVHPDAETVLTLLALWRLGAPVAPLNPRTTETERAAARAAAKVAPRGTQAVVWTSGTAGRARGVALSWGNLEASARAAAERLVLTDADVWLASLSPAHVGGLALVTRSILLGCTLVAAGAFDAATASDLVDGRGILEGSGRAVTHVSLVPTQLVRLLDARHGKGPPRSFRCALVGGAHAPQSLVARARRAGWPLALTYGSTEMSSQIATAAPERTETEPGTVGVPLDGVEVRLDEEDQILARGPTLATAYLFADGTTTPVADDDGWYRTGDLGRIDAAGRLWVTGRRVDRIVSGGVTIDAVEVEEALRAHPSVLDACVVGLPDDAWGERVGAWVEPVVGEFDQEAVERHLRARLQAAKLPRVWRIGGRLPRNANGKVDRAIVRSTLTTQGPGPAPGP